MTYSDTAALQGAGSSEALGDVNETQEVRQWTVKNLDSEAVELARAAAKRKGMKIGAWVSETLRMAADSQLNVGQPSPSQLSIDLERLLSRLEEIRVEDHLRIERMERDISQLVKGQHGILAGMVNASKETSR